MNSTLGSVVPLAMFHVEMIFFFGLKTASVTASLAERLREVRSSFTWSVLILPCWSITGWQLHDQLSADKPLLLSSLPHPASPHGRHGSLPCALEGCPSQLFLQIIHRLSSSILSFSDSTVYKRKWRQTDIHGGGSQRAHELFIKVFKSLIFHSRNWSPGLCKIMFRKNQHHISPLRLLGGLLLDMIPFPFLMAAISFPLALIVAGINFVSSFTVLLALVHSLIMLSVFPQKTIWQRSERRF